MTRCRELLDHLSGSEFGALPEELRRHLDSCETCQEALARRQAVAEAASTLRAVMPPADLLAHLCRAPRFPAGCEEMLNALGEALSSSLAGPERTRFLLHLQGCERCRTVWEALATLREAGLATVAPRHLCALAALPPRQRLAIRRRRGLFDLRLAVAAAYLFAALTVVLVGNPALMADRGATQLTTATTYVRAAVANRFASFGRRVQEGVTTTSARVVNAAQQTWQQMQQFLSGRHENTADDRNV